MMIILELQIFLLSETYTRLLSYKRKFVSCKSSPDMIVVNIYSRVLV